MAAISISVSADPIDPAALTGAACGADESAGAIASFIGQVRGGDDLEALELEHFPGLTEAALTRIAEAAAARWSLTRAVIIHRVGRMQTGAPIVFVLAAAPHRDAAFDAARYMIDVLKTQAPFWKKEYRAAGARWVEPGPDDHAAASAWLSPSEEA